MFGHMMSPWQITWRLEVYLGELVFFCYPSLCAWVFTSVINSAKSNEGPSRSSKHTVESFVKGARSWRWVFVRQEDNKSCPISFITTLPCSCYIFTVHSVWAAREDVIFLVLCPVGPPQPSSHLLCDAGTFEGGLQSGAGRRTEPGLVSEGAWHCHIPRH